jgi:hypothetical protein
MTEVNFTRLLGIQVLSECSHLGVRPHRLFADNIDVIKPVPEPQIEPIISIFPEIFTPLLQFDVYYQQDTVFEVVFVYVN